MMSMRKKHWHNRQVVGMFTPLRQRISPPFRVLRELFHRVFPLRPISRLSEFQIPSRYNPRSPNSIDFLFRLLPDKPWDFAALTHFLPKIEKT